MSTKKNYDLKGLNSFGITEENLKMLEEFIKLLKFNYSLLNIAHLKFFKHWLVYDLKAQIPKSITTSDVDHGDKAHRNYFTLTVKSDNSSSSETWCSDADESYEKYHPDGSMNYVEEPLQEMGNSSRQATEAEKEEAMIMRNFGIDALNDGNFEAAIQHLTSAILLDSSSSLLFLKRAIAFLHASKPHSAIHDCKKAITLDSNCASAYITLGNCYMKLNNMVDACFHFEEAQAIEYNSEIDEIIDELRPKAVEMFEKRKLREKKRKLKEAEGRRIKRNQQKISTSKYADKGDQEKESFYKEQPRVPIFPLNDHTSSIVSHQWNNPKEIEDDLD